MTTSADRFDHRATNEPAARGVTLAGRLSRDAIEARRSWWAHGAAGHYPDCPCGHCVAVTIEDAAVAAAWAAIPPRPHTETAGFRRRTRITATMLGQFRRSNLAIDAS